MAIATAAGTVTPGGPMTSFPLVTVLRDSGTGIGALVAYVTAWTTMGLQRVFMWEVPLMGAEFADRPLRRLDAAGDHRRTDRAAVSGRACRSQASAAANSMGTARSLGVWRSALGVLVWVKRGRAEAVIAA